MKNRLDRAELCAAVAALTLSIGMAALFPKSALAIFSLGSLLCVAIIIFFDFRREKKINELTKYLSDVQNGLEELDLRSYEEGALSVLKSEIYKLTLLLKEQAEASKKSKLFLADALSNISHQLKTPLTSMMIMAELLRDEAIEPQKREEFLSGIESRLERMRWLVQNLLVLSRLDAGTLSLRRERVKASKLLKEACEPLLLQAELRGQELVIECGEELYLYCDAHWSCEAISNIVKNCVEHTREGGLISVSCAQTALYTRITIKDNGEGIDPQELPHIFERFYKGKGSSADSVGIGLALAKQIIMLQEGDISVKSEPGKGSVFTVSLYSKREAD